MKFFVHMPLELRAIYPNQGIARLPIDFAPLIFLSMISKQTHKNFLSQKPAASFSGKNVCSGLLSTQYTFSQWMETQQ